MEKQNQRAQTKKTSGDEYDFIISKEIDFGRNKLIEEHDKATNEWVKTIKCM